VKSVAQLQHNFKGLFITLGSILTLFLLIFAYRFFIKHKESLLPKTPPLSPEEAALEALHELFDSDLLRREMFKIYYLRLSEILRIYFEKRYKILAVESTTTEIMSALKGLSLSSDLMSQIGWVLENSDLAKFAKWIPTPAESSELDKKSEQIIHACTPQEGTKEEEETQEVESKHGV